MIFTNFIDHLVKKNVDLNFQPLKQKKKWTILWLKRNKML